MTKEEKKELVELRKLVATLREIIQSMESVVGLLTRELKTAKATIADLRRHTDDLAAQIKARDENL